MRSWLMTVAANIVFGQEALDAFKDAKHPNSPGGDKYTVEEIVEIASHATAHMTETVGIKPQVDITLLPSRERMKELLTNAGFTVIDKGAETAPTGKPLINSLVAQTQPAPAEAVTEISEETPEPDDGKSAEDADEPAEEKLVSRRRRK